MPPLPPANKILKVRFLGTYGDAKWNCIMHSQYLGSTPTSSDLLTYATSVSGAWSNNIAPLCSNGVTLHQVDAIDLSSPTSASASVIVAAPGTRGPTDLPASVSLVSSWKVNLRYRGGHVRNYWPGGVAADQADTRLWKDTSIAAFTAGFEAFRTAVNALTLAAGATQLVLLSYKSGHVFRPTPLPAVIQSVAVHPRLDTQRRRLGKEIA